MPDKKLCVPNGVPLDFRGSLTVTLSQKQHKCDPRYICESSRASSHQRLALIISSLQPRMLPYYCYQTRVSKLIYRAGNTPR